MSTKEKDPQIVKLNGVRLFFPNLFTAKSFKNEAGKPKTYGARFWILKSDTAQIALVNAARARAMIHDRDYVVPEDLFALAEDVLLHRMRLTYQAMAEGFTPMQILRQIMAEMT